MSSGQKRAAEDEDDWDSFKARTGLIGVPWKTYSREAAAADLLNRRLHSTGLLLKLDVLQHIAQEDLLAIHTKEREAFIAAEALIKKYA